MPRTALTPSVREIQAHFAEAFRVVAPVFAYLHEQEEMNVLLKDFGELAARCRRDRLDGFATLAKRDLLLAVAFDIDDLLDAYRAVFALFPLLGLDMRGIGKFLMQAQEEL